MIELIFILEVLRTIALIAEITKSLLEMRKSAKEVQFLCARCSQEMNVLPKSLK